MTNSKDASYFILEHWIDKQMVAKVCAPFKGVVQAIDVAMIWLTSAAFKWMGKLLYGVIDRLSTAAHFSTVALSIVSCPGMERHPRDAADTRKTLPKKGQKHPL